MKSLPDIHIRCNVEVGTPHLEARSAALPRSLKPPPSRGAFSVALLSVFALTVAAEALLAGHTVHGYAAALTPPAPPTYVPTPIGSPPPPPTFTPTAGPSPTSTVVVTPTALAIVRRDFVFSLDAVRVSRPNNPGNMSGLAAVKPGTKVWLMMYYTVTSLPKKASRVTTYAIQYRDKTVYKVAYRSAVDPSDIGRFSRYTIYSVPKSLPFGPYVYRASLAIGKLSKSKSWKFAVAKQERPATSGKR
jgi:hypothetical protein